MKLALDIDCVLNNFEKDFCNRFGWDRRNLYSLQARYPRKTTEINDYLNDPQTYANLEVVPLAYEYFRLMQKEHEVYIATSRPENCFDVTVRWLEENYIEPEDLIFSYTDKVSLIKKAGITVMVDDSPHQLEEGKKAGIRTICWAQPWNIGIFPRLVPIGRKLLWYKQYNGACDVVLNIGGR